MTFPDAIRTCFTKFATFDGRAARPEFWYFLLFQMLLSLVTHVLDSAIFPFDLLSPLNLIATLIVLLPGIAVGVRRLHDIGRSGWWLLLGLVPVIGWIVLIVWLAQKSDPLANRFGEAAAGRPAFAVG